MMKLRNAIYACCLSLVCGAPVCVAQAPPAPPTPPGETLPTPRSVETDAASILERLKLVPPQRPARVNRPLPTPPARTRQMPSARSEYTDRVKRIQEKFRLLAERRKQADAKRKAEEKARAEAAILEAAQAAQAAQAAANASPTASATDNGASTSDTLLQPGAIQPAVPAPSPSPQLPINPSSVTGNVNGSPSGDASATNQLASDPAEAAAATAVLGNSPAGTTDDSASPAADPVTKQVGVEVPAEFLVTSQPIDSLAFANNMFAQGKIATARPVYEKLLESPQTAEDMIWIQYQLASCYRLEKDIKKATRYYRIVAADTTTEYWPSRARWWLDYISKSQNMYQRSTELENRFKKLQEQISELKE